jgi:hypothetical protein
MKLISPLSLFAQVIKLIKRKLLITFPSRYKTVYVLQVGNFYIFIKKQIFPRYIPNARSDPNITNSITNVLNALTSLEQPFYHTMLKYISNEDDILQQLSNIDLKHFMQQVVKL